MEYSFFIVASLFLVIWLIYAIIDDMYYNKYRSKLYVGAILTSKFYKMSDPFYNEGMDTCAIINLSNDYALVTFNDKHRTTFSVPIKYFYKNNWEIKN